MKTQKPLIVRCYDRMVFEVSRKTYEAKTTSRYDAYCYSDPLPDVEYISWSDWVQKRNEKRYELS